MTNRQSTDKDARTGFRPGKTLAICAVLVLAGVGVLWLIYGTEPTVQRESAVREAVMPVDTVTVARDDFRPEILATGTVIPSREVTLQPRVSGEVVSLSRALEPGGFVARGDVLLRIDEADYRIALEQRQSELQQAVSELEIERGRRDIAERDYRELGKELIPENRALVLREPQMKAAEARVRAAQAAVNRAELDLERTQIVAPFDAQVLNRQVELGSQVSPGNALARLVGVDTYWIETTIPLDRVRWLTLPDGPDDAGSPVTITHRTAWPRDRVREGRLYRLIGELEGDTRMARLLVSVDDPLSRKAENVDAPELVIGSFVQCRVLGRSLEDVVRLERDFVRKNDTVWVADDGQLAIRVVDVVFQDAQYAYIGSGLEDGDQVITTSLATVKEGTRLQVRATGASGS